jgi:hypothetical protein
MFALCYRHVFGPWQHRNSSVPAAIELSRIFCICIRLIDIQSPVVALLSPVLQIPVTAATSLCYVLSLLFIVLLEENLFFVTTDYKIY